MKHKSRLCLLQTKTKNYQKKILTGQCKKKLIAIGLEINQSKIDHIFEKHSQDFLKNVITSSVKKDFWKHASVSTKKALVFSWQHQKLGRNQTLNVQIEDWRKNIFLKQIYDSKKIASQFKIKNINKAGLRAFVDTGGAHEISLRLENIHLSFDSLNDKLLPLIHCDLYWPGKSLASFLAHMIGDVLKDFFLGL